MHLSVFTFFIYLKSFSSIGIGIFGNFAGWDGGWVGGWTDTVIIKLNQSSQSDTKTELGNNMIMIKMQIQSE